MTTAEQHAETARKLSRTASDLAIVEAVLAVAATIREAAAVALADVWDDGYTRGFYDREALDPTMPGRDASEGRTPNPYHPETP
ncbi:MAG: hypothetical protein Q4F65_00975 [Propionibacteriaceae bacterium]|nr:hypothetical protein [Propionibacteriaceae bacterium]